MDRGAGVHKMGADLWSPEAGAQAEIVW
jgi:hypothetical protein